jgi:hypothetical protein
MFFINTRAMARVSKTAIVFHDVKCATIYLFTAFDDARRAPNTLDSSRGLAAAWFSRARNVHVWVLVSTEMAKTNNTQWRLLEN